MLVSLLPSIFALCSHVPEAFCYFVPYNISAYHIPPLSILHVTPSKNKYDAEEKAFNTRPGCGFNRALELKVTDTVQLRFCYCFSLNSNVQLVKRDIVTAVIYCYITTDFHYAKCDSRLSAYGGVMLQRVCIEKNVNRHFSLNFTKFCNKNN